MALDAGDKLSPSILKPGPMVLLIVAFYTHTHTHTHAHTHTHTHTHARTHAHTHARTHARTCVCVWARTHRWHSLWAWSREQYDTRESSSALQKTIKIKNKNKNKNTKQKYKTETKQRNKNKNKQDIHARMHDTLTRISPTALDLGMSAWAVRKSWKQRATKQKQNN